MLMRHTNVQVYVLQPGQCCAEADSTLGRDKVPRSNSAWHPFVQLQPPADSTAHRAFTQRIKKVVSGRSDCTHTITPLPQGSLCPAVASRADGEQVQHVPPGGRFEYAYGSKGARAQDIKDVTWRDSLKEGPYRDDQFEPRELPWYYVISLCHQIYRRTAAAL